MLDPEHERYLQYLDRPLWESLNLTNSDPYGGLYGPLEHGGRGRRGYVVCRACGARVEDRGLHYRFHAQIAMLLSTVVGKREVLSVITDEDEEDHDGEM